MSKCGTREKSQSMSAQDVIRRAQPAWKPLMWDLQQQRLSQPTSTAPPSPQHYPPNWVWDWMQTTGGTTHYVNA